MKLAIVEGAVIVASRSRKEIETRGYEQNHAAVRVILAHGMLRNSNSKLENLFVRGRNLSALREIRFALEARLHNGK